MLGNKLWFPFFNEGAWENNDWETKVQALIREMGKNEIRPLPSLSSSSNILNSPPTASYKSPQPQRIRSSTGAATPPPLSAKPVPTLANPAQLIQKWTIVEVVNWLRASNQLPIIPLFQELNIRGAALVEWHQILICDHKFAHEFAKSFGLGLSDTLVLFHHLRQLML